jgi:hypothetical protein
MGSLYHDHGALMIFNAYRASWIARCAKGIRRGLQYPLSLRLLLRERPFDAPNPELGVTGLKHAMDESELWKWELQNISSVGFSSSAWALWVSPGRNRQQKPGRLA